MSYTVKTEEPCVYCGTMTFVRQKWSRAPIRMEHGIMAAVNQIRDASDAKERRIKKEKALYAKQKRASRSR